MYTAIYCHMARACGSMVTVPDPFSELLRTFDEVRTNRSTTHP